MPTDDEVVAQYLNAVMDRDIKNAAESFQRSVFGFADDIDKHIEDAFDWVRASLHESDWIPKELKSHIYLAPPRPPVPQTFWQRATKWLGDNTALAAAIVAFLGTGTFIIWRGRRRFFAVKRHRRRGHHGERLEAVLLVGSAYDALSASVAQDLEKRGFVVVLAAENPYEGDRVRTGAKGGIEYLDVDLSTDATTRETVNSFQTLLRQGDRSIGRTLSSSHIHPLNFRAIVMLPPPSRAFPTGTMGTISRSAWTDTLNGHVIAPITFLKTFLPLLLSKKESKSHSRRPEKSLVVMSHSAIPSLRPAFHGPESVAIAGLTAYIDTLHEETYSRLNVSHVKLGALDLQGLDSTDHQGQLVTQTQQPIFGVFHSGSPGRERRTPKATSLRKLHNHIYSTIVECRQGTSFVGNGARIYHLFGTYAPASFLRWIMTGRRLSSPTDDFSNLHESPGGKGQTLGTDDSVIGIRLPDQLGSRNGSESGEDWDVLGNSLNTSVSAVSTSAEGSSQEDA